MSIATQMADAAGQAQAVLAQVGGTPPDKKNSLYNGKAYLGVYGIPQVEREMLAGGGYRQRTALDVTVTRAQFLTPPVAKAKWTRTDLVPNLIYTIEKVGMHDALLYTLTVYRPGE